jgi:hypothetical protein
MTGHGFPSDFCAMPGAAVFKQDAEVQKFNIQ